MTNKMRPATGHTSIQVGDRVLVSCGDAPQAGVVVALGENMGIAQVVVRLDAAPEEDSDTLATEEIAFFLWNVRKIAGFAAE